MNKYEIIIRKSKEFNINLLGNISFLEHIATKKLHITNFDVIKNLIKEIEKIEADNRLSNE